MNARFKVENVFTIAGRGPVASGKILEGSLKVGMFTQPLEIKNELKPLKINGVEMANRVGSKKMNVGLLLENAFNAEMLESALPKNSIIFIFKNEKDAFLF